MFQGPSAISLDAKGRMSIPSQHRDALALQGEGRVTLTRHPDGCLLLFPRPAWETIFAPADCLLADGCARVEADFPR